MSLRVTRKQQSYIASPQWFLEPAPFNPLKVDGSGGTVAISKLLVYIMQYATLVLWMHSFLYKITNTSRTLTFRLTTKYRDVDIMTK